MLDRFKYCLGLNINGYGRPGTIKPDNMFSTIFRLVTPTFVNDLIRKFTGSSGDVYGSQKEFMSVASEFTPPKAPPGLGTNIGEDKIINDIYDKLNAI